MEIVDVHPTILEAVGRRDPNEQVNLIGHPEYADVEREMRERLLRAVASRQCRYGGGGEVIS